MSALTTDTSLDLSYLGIQSDDIRHNLSADKLTSETIAINEGELADCGALRIFTGKFTGRSPKDRYIVKDFTTENTVDWNSINQPITSDIYQELKSIVVNHINKLGNLYVHDGQAGAAEAYRINVRLIAEKPWSAQFANNMFLRLPESASDFVPGWHILCAPTCTVEADRYGLNNNNFVIVNMAEKTVLIAGSGYTGEIKKSIFSILNYLLPIESGVLPMHCSANVGKDGDTAIFFGLSGTGKTTLSTDPERQLIGDDEHGWSEEGVFNFEGGCYAKCINLDKDKEPEIYQAIKKGAILENINFIEGTTTPDYTDTSITQNTRVSYPIYHIDNIKEDSQGGHPQHIFFLTCDAFGVLPPVSKLNRDQAMYHFISGYTAKVAGTELGVTEPEATFSACFGAPFLPLHPGKYADMLGSKMDRYNTHTWLINTGWTGGANPQGERISLKYTRSIINSILKNDLLDVPYETMDIFDLRYPTTCPGVPSEILNPINTWSNKDAYYAKAELLADLFVKNFIQYENGVSENVKSAAPIKNFEHVM